MCCNISGQSWLVSMKLTPCKKASKIQMPHFWWKCFIYRLWAPANGQWFRDKLSVIVYGGWSGCQLDGSNRRKWVCNPFKQRRYVRIWSTQRHYLVLLFWWIGTLSHQNRGQKQNTWRISKRNIQVMLQEMVQVCMMSGSKARSTTGRNNKNNESSDCSCFL